MTDEGLTPELLLQAYAAGVFPMAESRHDTEVFWVDPRHRGVLPLDGFHISRSLARRMRRSDWRLTFDRDFEGVIDACADRPETWINSTVRRLCLALFGTGDAHSVELWEGEALIGGVYGIALGRAFFGESMFSRRTDASKIALAALVDRLETRGYVLFDTQFLTPHLATLGAVEISRDTYRKRLKEALSDGAADFGPAGPGGPLQDVLQRMTHTS